MAKILPKSSGNKASHANSETQRHNAKQSASAARPPLAKAELLKFDIPADVVESHEEIQAPRNLPGTQLWLLQLPAEMDLSEGLTWDVKNLADGRVTATCQDPEGTHFTMTEQAKELANPYFTAPPSGATVMSTIAKTMTVTETANLLPDPTADAERVQAAMPSADIPGVSLLTDTRSQGAAELDMSNKAIQKQQARQEHQAGQDMMASPLSPKQKHKKVKSESKKLKKRAQEATAVNEKQSKLQRQSSAPLLDTAALQVSAPADLKSEAAKIQDEELAKSDGKDKKQKKKKKVKEAKS